MPEMPSKAEVTREEVVEAYNAKLDAMITDGRVDTSKLDAIVERVVRQVIQRELAEFKAQFLAVIEKAREATRDAK